MEKKQKSKSICLQRRDLSLIRIMAEEFPLLIREQIAELVPMGSVRRVNFRLKQLCDTGFLSSRRLNSMGAYSKLGYYLGPRAEEVFKNPTEQRLARDIRSKGKRLSRVTLDHRIMVDWIHIRFLMSSRNEPNYKLVTWIDQYSSEWKELKDYGVPVQADGYGEYIQYLQFDNLHTFFLEVDRSTERGEIMRDKIERYIKFAESGKYERAFAAKAFRVLFVVESERRMKSLLKYLKKQKTDIFWLTTWTQFKESKLFDSYWYRPQHEGLFSLSFHS